MIGIKSSTHAISTFFSWFSSPPLILTFVLIAKFSLTFFYSTWFESNFLWYSLAVLLLLPSHLFLLYPCKLLVNKVIMSITQETHPGAQAGFRTHPHGRQQAKDHLDKVIMSITQETHMHPGAQAGVRTHPLARGRQQAEDHLDLYLNLQNQLYQCEYMFNMSQIINSAEFTSRCCHRICSCSTHANFQ